MIPCPNCNGIGYTGIRNGDDDKGCTVCHGTGEAMSQLTIAEARDILRCRGYGGKVTERLYNEALGLIQALEPVIEYVLVDDDDDPWYPAYAQEVNSRYEHNNRWDER